ncbi:ATPase [Luminiphilus syltensis NOR5-1B]|uniref:Probable periplasmic serine endoprotease DegP-like n=2 Tax=Luminiphilus TaxID=1341118 RepID=B8KRG4_9GAMM|nr:ATPase [Luminiphilus syltensis NOR5-1B]
MLVLLLLWSPILSAQALPDFSSIVEDATPAVVKILVSYDEKEAIGQVPDMQQLPEYLRRFFEGRGGNPQPRERASIGSGFVISEDGYVVTNNHVVEGASGVTVRLIDRRDYDAEIIGLDPRSDLALLKIDADDLATLKLGRNDKTKVGQWVLAIGSPFGLDFSVSAGIVSAKGRSLPTERGENYVPFLQTDVAINPGNSGGPLFNIDGEVIGVNSQIFTRSGGSIGLSFAIPVNVVRNVVEQLKENGEVVRGWLGVSIQDVDRNLAESFGLDRPQGALVAQVGEDSPAERAGIEAGDVIIKFDGQTIDTSADLPHVVGLLAPGSMVDAQVIRDGKRITLEVEVGGLDADDRPSVASSGNDAGNSDVLGMVVESADMEAMAELGLNGGVLITAIRPDSPAADANVMPGDIVTRLGNIAVSDLEDFAEAATQLEPGKSVRLRVFRRGSPLFIGIRVPKESLE